MCSTGWHFVFSFPSCKQRWRWSSAEGGAPEKACSPAQSDGCSVNTLSTLATPRYLTGNFNAHLEECVLLFVDEAFWAGDKQGEAQLKRMITEPTIMIERKGFDSEMAPNRLHIVMASNSDWVIPAGIDERRFAVLDVDGAKQQDERYFGAIQNELDTGGYEALLHDLSTAGSDNFQPSSCTQDKGSR